ncbi:probable ATP-dependent RNA helicase vasa-like isoform X2 [Stegodyphus dumicola]|uniref:probable ATP-dependent RNA helicase vasa-like isoform X2 n=1 Tax=Stegodyphus dumicola TaxID=202533 RepID=UPI0015ACD459|nr:probable ATP-dependent RNA helicase vasa-like isoform X2 [Stegodyphus dumicola]
MYRTRNIKPRSSGNSLAAGNGFYVGRGRGFGNMAAMNDSLPTVGSKSNNSGGWDDGYSAPSKSQSSGWEEDDWDKPAANNNKQSSWNDDSDRRQNTAPAKTESSGWEEDDWDKPAVNNNKQSSWNGDSDRRQGSSRNFRNNDHDDRVTRDYGDRDGGGRKCFNCNETGHMSRDCPNKDSRGGGDSRGSDRSCYKCNQKGHISRDCPNEGSGGGGGSDRSCYKCNQKGHISRDCPNEGSGGGGSDRSCYKCNQKGHISRDCPNQDSGDYNSNSDRGNRGSGCYKCHEDGHMARDCPNSNSDRSNTRSSGCYKCHEEGHIAKDCPNSDGDRNTTRGSGCFKCKEEGHMAKDCPNNLGEDGKPRPPPYVPPEPSEDEDIFQGVPTGINFSKYDEVHVDVSGTNVPRPIDSFQSSGLCQHLLQNISKCNYTKPTPVQKYAIPIILQKRDLMACAQTGSGKTAAFLLPILNDMIPNPNLPNNNNLEQQEPWAVIVAPTRELAVQIATEARKFAYDSCVKTAVVYGGTSVGYQTSRIRGIHLLVATPGRLLDFVEKGKVSFSQIRYFVLDEADRMLDMGFAPAIRKMVEHSSMPEKGVRQTLMFSATFPEDIQKMAGDFLDNYLFLTVGMVGAANADVEQTFFSVGQYDKRQKLMDILKDVGTDRTLVFVEQKRTADFIASLCSQNNIPTTSIHGDRLQREREEALRDFRTGKMPVLVATAVAARGLDIKDVKHVINYDLPQTIDEYVHRIGRTGRVGNLGKATSFYDSNADQPLARSLKKILIDAHKEVPDWLSQEADQAVGTTVQYGGRGNFGSRDVRNNRGRDKPINSNDAFNNYSSQPTSFSEPVADEEDWG